MSTVWSQSTGTVMVSCRSVELHLNRNKKAVITTTIDLIMSGLLLPSTLTTKLLLGSPEIRGRGVNASFTEVFCRTWKKNLGTHNDDLTTISTCLSKTSMCLFVIDLVEPISLGSVCSCLDTVWQMYSRNFVSG